MIEKEIIEAHALENSLLHKGKAKTQAVLNALFAEGLEKKDIPVIIPKINEIIKKVNSLSEKERQKRYDEIKDKAKKREIRTGLPPLEKAKVGEVVMRIAPFPSGPLHIGNARPLILNDEYTKKYDGKLIFVMDDTIGSSEKPVEPDAYNLIKEGVDWLGIGYDKIIYKSDRLETYYAYAEEMIKKGYMYVCSCSQEEMHELRVKGISCGCRELDSEEQMKRWKKMFSASKGEFTIRLKTSMQDPNPAFRDRVMFKISERTHPRVGKKYRVWPTLDFSWAIDDHLLGITHILRGIDLQIETKTEKFIWDIFKWEHPVVIYNGFLNIEGVKISKSKGAREVKSGEYIGWNDPRLWSLQSLRDRGILAKSIREFILSMGVTKSNSTIAVDVLYALNRKNLEDAPRYFFIENPVKIKISGAPKLNAKLPLHPSKKLGFREYQTMQEFYITKRDFDLIDGANYRLMHLFNFKTSHNPLRGKEFNFISEKPDKSLNARYMHWLPANEDNIKVNVRMPDNLIVSGLGEPGILKLKKGEIVQFERFGFARLHKLNKKERTAEFWFAHR